MCIYVCMSVSIYVCMYVCMYVYTTTHTHTHLFVHELASVLSQDSDSVLVHYTHAGQQEHLQDVYTCFLRGLTSFPHLRFVVCPSLCYYYYYYYYYYSYYYYYYYYYYYVPHLRFGVCPSLCYYYYYHYYYYSYYYYYYYYYYYVPHSCEDAVHQRKNMTQYYSSMFYGWRTLPTPARAYSTPAVARQHALHHHARPASVVTV
jgi:hypothetical protein